jgi:hypothetical protein
MGLSSLLFKGTKLGVKWLIESGAKGAVKVLVKSAAKISAKIGTKARSVFKALKSKIPALNKSWWKVGINTWLKRGIKAIWKLAKGTVKLAWRALKGILKFAFENLDLLWDFIKYLLGTGNDPTSEEAQKDFKSDNNKNFLEDRADKILKSSLLSKYKSTLNNLLERKGTLESKYEVSSKRLVELKEKSVSTKDEIESLLKEREYLNEEISSEESFPEDERNENYIINLKYKQISNLYNYEYYYTIYKDQLDNISRLSKDLNRYLLNIQSIDSLVPEILESIKQLDYTSHKTEVAKQDDINIKVTTARASTFALPTLFSGLAIGVGALISNFLSKDEEDNDEQDESDDTLENEDPIEEEERDLTDEEIEFMKNFIENYKYNYKNWDNYDEGSSILVQKFGDPDFDLYFKDQDQLFDEIKQIAARDSELFTFLSGYGYDIANFATSTGIGTAAGMGATAACTAVGSLAPGIGTAVGFVVGTLVDIGVGLLLDKVKEDKINKLLKELIFSEQSKKLIKSYLSSTGQDVSVIDDAYSNYNEEPYNAYALFLRTLRHVHREQVNLEKLKDKKKKEDFYKDLASFTDPNEYKQEDYREGWKDLLFTTFYNEGSNSGKKNKIKVGTKYTRYIHLRTIGSNGMYKTRNATNISRLKFTGLPKGTNLRENWVDVRAHLIREYSEKNQEFKSNISSNPNVVSALKNIKDKNGDPYYLDEVKVEGGPRDLAKAKEMIELIKELSLRRHALILSVVRREL